MKHKIGFCDDSKEIDNRKRCSMMMMMMLMEIDSITSLSTALQIGFALGPFDICADVSIFFPNVDIDRIFSLAFISLVF